MRLVSRRGDSSASLSENFGRWLSDAVKRPCEWQARTRMVSITGVWLASDSSKDFCTARTSEGWSGRGSNSHICDFIANACERSWMMLEPSP